jgi:hypothetical protein
MASNIFSKGAEAAEAAAGETVPDVLERLRNAYRDDQERLQRKAERDRK